MSIQTTLGWHWEGVTASNAEAGFDRFPIEIIRFYQHKQHRIGAGLTYGLSPTLDLSDAGGENVKFKYALGFVIEYNYLLGPEDLGLDLVLGMHYASISYQIESIDGAAASTRNKINGSYVGLVFGIGF